VSDLHRFLLEPRALSSYDQFVVVVVGGGGVATVISVAVSPQDGAFATGSGDFRARCWRYKAGAIL
jgi:hypothetical protein